MSRAAGAREDQLPEGPPGSWKREGLKKLAACGLEGTYMFVYSVT